MVQEPWNWFEVYWSWLGLGISLILFVLLFATDRLRSDIARSRWALAITVLGRNALPVFATGTVLGYVIQILRETLLGSTFLDLVLIGVGLNIQLLVAALRERAKTRAKATTSPG